MMKNVMTTNETKNFKSVLVYTGYAENGIENVEVINASSIEETIKLIEQEQLDLILEDDEENGEEYFEEFFGHGQVVNGIGLVEGGEENIILVLDETNEWYSKVDSYEKWSDETFNNWVKFLETF